MRGDRVIVGAGFSDGAVAPVMSGAAKLLRCFGSEFAGLGRDEHGFGAKMFAKDRLAHIQALS